MVNAIAPNAPTGASRTTMRMMPKKKSLARSTTSSTAARFSPSAEIANAASSEGRITCSKSPDTNAPTNVLGMMLSRNSAVLSRFAFWM